MTLPEGRQPIEWADLTPKHSTWEAEAKALRARVEALEAVLTYIRDGEKLNHVHMRRAAAVALQQPTEPHTATHSANSTPPKG